MISGIDHVAITAADLARTVEFYRAALDGVVVRHFQIDGAVVASQLAIGGAMLNVHQAGHGHALVAQRPTPGSTDLCFRWGRSIESAMERLTAAEVPILEGPVPRVASDDRTGLSVYFRDPDGNLLELLTTVEEPAV